MNMKKIQFGSYVIFIVLLLGSVTMVFPFLWMVSTSLKNFNEIFTVTPHLIPKAISFDKYISVWQDTLIANGLLNSLLIALGGIVVGTFTSSLSAFSFSKLNLPKGNILFMILLSTIMLPFAVTMIPQFVAFTKMGWVDTWLPLIVPALFGNIGMIFFLKQFMVGIPNELFDAARVDGCSPFKMFYKIMFPIVKPAVAVQFILWFMGSWNDFLGPIIYINTPEKLPVQAVIATLKSYYVSGTDFALVMTASVIALMPILIIFIVFNRYFVDTLALSGLKG